MAALRAGKHVLVEKPLAASTAEAMEIAETADRLHLAAMVGHTFQYNPAVNVVRDLIGSGELGRVYYINATRANLGLLQPDINVVWDLAPHDVSILLHILGTDPFQVSASGQVYIQRRKAIHEVAYLTFYFPSHILANVRVSWLDPVKQRRITVVGSRKMLVYDDIADDKVRLFDIGVECPPYSDTPEAIPYVVSPWRRNLGAGSLAGAAAGRMPGIRGLDRNRPAGLQRRLDGYEGRADSRNGPEVAAEQRRPGEHRPVSEHSNIRIAPDVKLGRDVKVYAFRQPLWL